MNSAKTCTVVFNANNTLSININAAGVDNSERIEFRTDSSSFTARCTGIGACSVKFADPGAQYAISAVILARFTQAVWVSTPDCIVDNLDPSILTVKMGTTDLSCTVNFN